VRAAFGADRLAAEGAVIDAGDDIVGAVCVVERAHDLELGLAADRAGGGLHHMVAGVALVAPFFFRYVLRLSVFPRQGQLLLAPLHA